MKSTRGGVDARYITDAALTGAAYTVLTLLCGAAGLSSGPVQLRLSESLCVLCLFTPAAVPGLAIGCFISNLVTGGAVWDLIFGTAATVMGALGVRLCRGLPRKLRPWLGPVPYFAANALIIPPVIYYAYGLGDALPVIYLTVGGGEALSAWLCGALLYLLLRRTGIDTLIKSEKKQ